MRHCGWSPVDEKGTEKIVPVPPKKE